MLERLSEVPACCGTGVLEDLFSRRCETGDAFTADTSECVVSHQLWM